MSDFAGQASTAELVKRLRAYCAAKPGVLQVVPLSRYCLVAASVSRCFAEFFLDEQPVLITLRLSDDDLSAYANRSALYDSQQMRWDGEGWKWVDLVLDDTGIESDVLRLLDSAYDMCFRELSPHDQQLVAVGEASTDMLEIVDMLIRLNRLAQRRDEIVSLLQPAVLMRTHAVDEADLALGQTKIGGLPDLPKSWDYPHFDGTALAFLAQVNLAEIPPDHRLALLPAHGILYCFSAFGWQRADGDIDPDLAWERSGESDFSQVLYYDGALDQLERRPKPDNKKGFKATAVDFLQVLTLPRAAPYCRDVALATLDWSEDEFSQFDTLYFDFRYVMDRQIGVLPQHRLLGYAEPIQSRVTTADTRLLCQIDSDYHDAGGDMMWVDGGIIYFTIEHARLQAGDFTHVGSVCQFS